ncbi:uncharacterized protein LOC126903775 [Daktulosphaira vitifoliae]|uniref:uncharacterized protein LOC126903775 n=1 Tax=Daktulosphaira vitifoliae TaxID=58002 RepID=UPI0021AA7B46|nr:uncharacterized protein LOC126903775 [Daktulosphaira vitifoliae]
MFSLKIVKIIFLLFYVILYTKTQNTTKIKILQLDTLLNYPGWKILNDVYSIKYLNKKYYLKSLIEIPTNRSKCIQKIRALTIYLGCTYGKVMNNLFSIIINMITICQEKILGEHDFLNGCIYTEELIDLIATFIVPTATLMKNAMDALDLLHDKPWFTFTRNQKHYYIMSPLLETIANVLHKLNERSLSRDNISTYFWILDTVFDFFLKIIKNIKKEMLYYCTFVPYDTNYLWNEWNQEYKIIIDQGIKLIFFKFLIRKIKNYIKTEIIEKYFQLGFKYDSITEETFVPKPKELIELDEVNRLEEELKRLVVDAGIEVNKVKLIYDTKFQEVIKETQRLQMEKKTAEQDLEKKTKENADLTKKYESVVQKCVSQPLVHLENVNSLIDQIDDYKIKCEKLMNEVEILKEANKENQENYTRKSARYKMEIMFLKDREESLKKHLNSAMRQIAEDKNELLETSDRIKVLEMEINKSYNYRFKMKKSLPFQEKMYQSKLTDVSSSA